LYCDVAVRWQNDSNQKKTHEKNKTISCESAHAVLCPGLAGRDSDGDGYSDLEELIHGTNPTNSASAPTNFPHLDD